MSNSIHWDKDKITINSDLTDISSKEIRANDIYSNGYKVVTLENLKLYDEQIKKYITEQLDLVKYNKKQYIKMYDGEDY